MVALAAFAVFLRYKKSFQPKAWMWKGFIFAIALPLSGKYDRLVNDRNGRDPWVVYGLMKITDAVSPTVGAASMLISLIGLP
jgi:cytochrome d ubiquinol oxidase subunit I